VTPTAIALSAGWAAAVLAGAWRRRPLPARATDALVPVTRLTGSTVAPDGLSPALAGILTLLCRRPVSAPTAQRLAAAGGAGMMALVVLPAAAPFVAGALWGWPSLRARRRTRAARAAVLAHLPETVDLFVLAAAAGLTVPLAVDAVARRAPGPLAEALARANAEVGLGRRLADALDDVVALLGEPVRPLIAALVASERYGAPLLDRLTRLSADVRAVGRPVR